MIEESKYCSDVVKIYFNKELVMTKKDNEDFENSTKFSIWDKDYIDSDVKVRDHCYITGKYKVSVHRDCNINVELNHKFPVVFHNLKIYDSHLIMQELGKFNIKLNFIPNWFEKYMSFSINNKLSFIDSFQFLNSSLDSLVKNLGKYDCKSLSEELDNNELDLVKQKGFYPYEDMNYFEKFKEELLSKEKFYSSLTGTNLSDKEYDHILKVWNKFETETMKDYHDLYLKCDVLLLSAPALSWEAMLNMTKIKLELISNPDLYIFFEKDLRGGVSYVSNRHSKASNKYLISYDPKQESKHYILRRE